MEPFEQFILKHFEGILIWLILFTAWESPLGGYRSVNDSSTYLIKGEMNNSLG